MSDADLHPRLARLLDREEIESLHQRYLIALDGRDCGAFLTCFASDAVVEVVGTFYQGHGQIPQILEMMDSVAASIGETRQSKTTPIMRHITSNHAIEIAGNTAQFRANWLTLLESEDGPPTVATMGHYSDNLSRISGEWLFTRRRIIQDMPR